MTKGWTQAQDRLGVDGRGDTVATLGEVPGVDAEMAAANEGRPVFFVENFRLSSIAMPEDAGAIVRVRPLTRTEAMKLARLDETVFAVAPEHAMSFFEKELAIGDLPRARLAPGTRYVVGERVTWRDVRWFLIEYVSDGDGVVP